MNYLSANIRHLRRSKGISQAELAKNFGKKQNTVGNWENGISEPSIKELVVLSQIFMVDMSDLVNRNLEHGYDQPETSAHKMTATGQPILLTDQDKQLEGFWLTLRELRVIREKLDQFIPDQGNHNIRSQP
jgi:putative transcriptional regulator